MKTKPTSKWWYCKIINDTPVYCPVYYYNLNKVLNYFLNNSHTIHSIHFPPISPKHIEKLNEKLEFSIISIDCSSSNYITSLNIPAGWSEIMIHNCINLNKLTLDNPSDIKRLFCFNVSSKVLEDLPPLPLTKIIANWTFLKKIPNYLGTSNILFFN